VRNISEYIEGAIDGEAWLEKYGATMYRLCTLKRPRLTKIPPIIGMTNKRKL